MAVAVAYASETGRAEALAWRCRSWLRLRDITCKEPVALDALGEADVTVIFAATAGDGAPPANAKRFWSALLRKGAPRLDGKKYALYGLGDARYGQKYNAFARRLDARLAQLGGVKLCERALGDACTLEGAESFLPTFFSNLSPAPGLEPALEASLNGRVGDEAPERIEDYAPPITVVLEDGASSVHEYERKLLKKEGCSTIVEAALTSTERLTSEDWWQEVRQHHEAAPPQPLRSRNHYTSHTNSSTAQNRGAYQEWHDPCSFQAESDRWEDQRLLNNH